jgi:hypothetical protein
LCLGASRVVAIFNILEINYLKMGKFCLDSGFCFILLDILKTKLQTFSVVQCLHTFSVNLPNRARHRQFHVKNSAKSISVAPSQHWMCGIWQKMCHSLFTLFCSHIDVLPTRSNPVLSSGSSSSISGSGYCSSTDLTVLGQSISYTLSQQRYPYLADYQVNIYNFW